VAVVTLCFKDCGGGFRDGRGLSGRGEGAEQENRSRESWGEPTGHNSEFITPELAGVRGCPENLFSTH